MNKKKLRDSIRTIRNEIISAPKSKFKIHRGKDAAFARLDRMYDETLSYEENALNSYTYFHSTFESLRYKVIEVAKRKLLKGLTGRKKLEAERAIYQSTDQSGRNRCGSTVERFIYYFFTKAGIEVEMGTDGRDLCVFTENAKYHVNAKHTVREKINDCDCPIMVCWGYDPNNKCAGFGEQGLVAWSAPDKITIIVHPQGRKDAQAEADKKGLDVKFLSLDAGIRQIKKIDSYNLAVA